MSFKCIKTHKKARKHAYSWIDLFKLFIIVVCENAFIQHNLKISELFITIKSVHFWVWWVCHQHQRGWLYPLISTNLLPCFFFLRNFCRNIFKKAINNLLQLEKKSRSKTPLTNESYYSLNSKGFLFYLLLIYFSYFSFPSFGDPKI